MENKSDIRRARVDQWLEALRSGKYKQGQNVLHNVKDNTYCCHGVFAVEVGIDNKRRPYRGNPNAASFNFGAPFDTEKNLPPIEWFVEMSGFPKEVRNRLWNRNDGNSVKNLFPDAETYIGVPLSFEQIADYIDENKEQWWKEASDDKAKYSDPGARAS